MIDFYDVLGIGLDADAEEIKKASKKLWLQTHPDKANCQANLDANAKSGQGNTTDRFNEVMLARDVLSDPERRKIYDSFGFDLGEERPEMEVWNIGLSTMAAPLGGFLLKTVLARVILWFIAFRWVGRIIVAGGVGSGILYYFDFSYRDYRIKSVEAMPFLFQFGIVNVVILLYWIWPLLADFISVAYLVTEVAGLNIFVENWKVGVGASIASLVVARLVRGWWTWIIGLEVLLGVVMLVALTVASGIMRLWIDSVQASRSEKVKAWRLSMRKDRSRLQNEVAELKRKLQVNAVLSDKDAVAAQRKKIQEDQAYWEKKMKEQAEAKR